MESSSKIKTSYVLDALPVVLRSVWKFQKSGWGEFADEKDNTDIMMRNGGFTLSFKKFKKESKNFSCFRGTKVDGWGWMVLPSLLYSAGSSVENAASCRSRKRIESLLAVPFDFGTFGYNLFFHLNRKPFP